MVSMEKNARANLDTTEWFSGSRKGTGMLLKWERLLALTREQVDCKRVGTWRGP